eukprot:7915045-Lingulodinium_polyedra.AAC.1
MGSTWSEGLRTVATNVWWLSVLTFADFAAFDLAYQKELNSGGGAVLDQSARLRPRAAAWMINGDAS